MRSIWSGAISFGLVNIPVKLGSAVESGSEINFDMLSKKDLAPIRYARIDTKTGKEVPWKDIVKGYEYTKGKYVVVSDEDFEKASPEKSHAIDMRYLCLSYDDRKKEKKNKHLNSSKINGTSV